VVRSGRCLQAASVLLQDRLQAPLRLQVCVCVCVSVCVCVRVCWVGECVVAGNVCRPLPFLLRVRSRFQTRLQGGVCVRVCVLGRYVIAVIVCRPLPLCCIPNTSMCAYPHCAPNSHTYTHTHTGAPRPVRPWSAQQPSSTRTHEQPSFLASNTLSAQHAHHQQHGRPQHQAVPKLRLHGSGGAPSPIVAPAGGPQVGWGEGGGVSGVGMRARVGGGRGGVGVWGWGYG